MAEKINWQLPWHGPKDIAPSPTTACLLVCSPTEHFPEPWVVSGLHFWNPCYQCWEHETEMTEVPPDQVNSWLPIYDTKAS